MEPPMTYVIAEPCIDLKDKACVGECPVDCIYEGERMLYIHPDECVDCGACEPVCPVEAIFYEDDVPGQWGQFTVENARFFDQLGSPGGPPRPAPCLTTPTTSTATSSTGSLMMSRPITGGATVRTLTRRRSPFAAEATAMTSAPGRDPAGRRRAHAQRSPAARAGCADG